MVSASVEEWILPWCLTIGITHVIATRLEQEDKILTGRLSTKNCYGLEKVQRIKGVFDLEGFSTIYAYGDSVGDKELIDIADVKYLRWKRI